MNHEPAPPNSAYFLPRDRLVELINFLRAEGRRLIGPTPSGETITLDELTDVGQLPRGLGLDNTPGRSRLIQTGPNRYFDYAPTATSWKRWTFPARVPQLEWSDDGDVHGVEEATMPAAFLGVRACELAALAVIANEKSGAAQCVDFGLGSELVLDETVMQPAGAHRA